MEDAVFIDRAIIQVKSGRGGDGASSFLREKFVPKGGPDGGDGGRGGHVYFKATKHMNTLMDLHYRRRFFAGDGGKGSGNNSHGKNGEDLYVNIPLGTVLKDREGSVIKDFVRDGEVYMLLRGGRGGRGNAKFRNSVRQTPRFYEKGEPCQEKEFALELKIIADVGIIGLANAGKSTLLSKISNAHPKIANYPFTTLTPVLGLVRYDEERAYVVADIPGLIEGAAEGRGLGIEFLRHIERTKVYIHLVDPTQGDAYKIYRIINKELGAYDKKLLKRPQVVFINKEELLSAKEKKTIREKFKKHKIAFDFISAKEAAGVDKVIKKVFAVLEKIKPEVEEIKPEARVFEDEGPSRIEKLDANEYRLVSSKVEKYIEMLDFNNPDTVHVFRNYLDKTGINKMFKAYGVKEGDLIVIGERDFVFSDEE